MRIFCFVLAFAVAACSREAPVRETRNPLDAARSAIVARNFAEAAELASDAVTEDSDDPAAHYELARAEALQGNEGRALSALKLAIEKGLGDTPRALSDPAFDRIRDSIAFAELEERASPSREPARQASRQTDRSQDAEPSVEIRSENGRETIRAGDVVIDTEI